MAPHPSAIIRGLAGLVNWGQVLISGRTGVRSSAARRAQGATARAGRPPKPLDAPGRCRFRRVPLVVGVEGALSGSTRRELLRVWPSPVVALNRAVAVAMVDGPAAALEKVEALEREGRLAGLPLPTGDQGRPAAPPRPPRGCGLGLRAALALTDNAAERAFLSEQLK